MQQGSLVQVLGGVLGLLWLEQHVLARLSGLLPSTASRLACQRPAPLPPTRPAVPGGLAGREQLQAQHPHAVQGPNQHRAQHFRDGGRRRLPWHSVCRPC